MTRPESLRSYAESTKDKGASCKLEQAADRIEELERQLEHVKNAAVPSVGEIRCAIDTPVPMGATRAEFIHNNLVKRITNAIELDQPTSIERALHRYRRACAKDRLEALDSVEVCGSVENTGLVGGLLEGLESAWRMDPQALHNSQFDI